jgi:hypothetical protein
MNDDNDQGQGSPAIDGQENLTFSNKIPYLVIQSGCLIAASELLSRIDSETQSRDEIAQATVRISNRIYERFVEISQERRKNRRHRVEVPVKVLAEDRVLDCTLLNISQGGAMVSPLLSLHVGIEIGLKIGRNKPLRARVAAIGAKQTNLAFVVDDDEQKRLHGIITKLIEAERTAGS